MRLPIAAILACASGAASLSAAQQLAEAEQAAVSPKPAPYEGHTAVRVFPSSPRQALALSAMSDGVTLVSEGFGTAQVDLILSPKALDAIRAMDFEFEVLHENVQRLVDAESARLLAGRAANAARGVDPLSTYFDDFRPFEDLPGSPTAAVDSADEFIDELAAQFPGLVTVSEIGTSIEGRTIRAFTISGAGDAATKPALCFNSGAHSREWIAPMSVNFIAKSLAEGYGSDPRITDLLDTVTFYIIPVIQPDGNIYSWTDERYWRKNRRNNGDGTFGVDWNRNFDSNFGGAGADSFTSSDIYHGPAPFSEPESQALRDFILARPNIATHIDFHSYSQLILWPYGYQFLEAPEPDRTVFRSLSEQMRDEMVSVGGVTYTAQPSHDLYLASGVSQDWVYEGAGVLSWTFELRPSGGQGLAGFSPTADQILPTAQENFAAIMLLGEAVAQGVNFAFPSGLPDVVASGTMTTIRVSAAAVLGEPLDASTATLWYDDGSGFVALPMSQSGAASYEAALPAVECGETLSYYISIETDSGTQYTSPSGAPAAETYNIEGADITLAFQDSFEQDLGWSASSTATSGDWQRGVPAVGDRGDPGTDADGSGQCYLTENQTGNTDIDAGSVTLLSPVLDLAPGITVEYAYWLNNTGAAWDPEDGMTVDVSLDGGGSWTNLQNYQTAAATWREDSFTVGSDFAASSQTRFRFVATDIGSGSIVEAGLDAFTASEIITCDCPADVDGNGELSPADFTAWLAAFNSPMDPNRDRADVNGDGSVTPADFTAWLAAFNAGCD